MRWSDAPYDEITDNTYVASLPKVTCVACGVVIPRRKHRMALRASWRDSTEYLCPYDWHQVCEWATRFALQQLELPLI
jgi:hypothetical protein